MLLFTAYVCSFVLAGLGRRDRHLVWLGAFATAILATAFLTTEFQSKAAWFIAAGATAILERPAASRFRRARAPDLRRATAFVAPARVDG
jgi:hypothetical protein